MSEVELTEADLRRRWPRCFNDARKPLKIGINVDMGVEFPNRAVGVWIGHPRYLRNTAAGMPRIDLDGKPQPPTPVDEPWWAPMEAYRRLQVIRSDLIHVESLLQRGATDAAEAAARRLLGFSIEDGQAELKLRMPKLPTRR
jgi:hypothetical protein